MKLKELFDYIGFDSMVPFLASYNTERSQIGYYKMAFDELLQIKARPNGSVVGIHMKHGLSGDYISVTDLEGSNWERCLGATLDIDDAVTASDAEIAARCLWGLTFYGYTQTKTGEINSYPKNIYSEKADAIWDKHFAKTAHLKTKMNRIKRMRYCRQMRMFRYYRQKSRRYEFLDVMAEMAGKENRESIMRMLEPRCFSGDEFYSWATTPDGHAAYLVELVGKYMRSEYEGKDRFIIVLSAPEDIIGKMEEQRHIFSDMFDSLTPDSSAKICFNTASKPDSPVIMFIAACKDE